MRILITRGRILDPSQGIDGIGDLLIEGGRIKEIRIGGSGAGSQESVVDSPAKAQTTDTKTIDAAGLLVLPGLVDLHVHLREPGFEYKETIATGTRAAVRGGFTSVCCMPNTNPVNDNATVTDFILRKTYAEGSCFVYPIGAITKGQRGEELAEMGMMCEAGCVAFSDDGHSVMNALVMRRALEYAKSFDVPIISHCEDLHLADGGVMNEGLLSSTLGLKGAPGAAEEVMVARDIDLSKLTGGRLHIAHVSTCRSVELIRKAKEEGVKVSAETCPHYFTITEKAVEGYNTHAKVNPPLRSARDIEAIKEGLRDGTIDAIATDHAPHHRDEKSLEFDKAPSGISGLETAFSLGLRLVEEGVLSLRGLIEKMALNPAALLLKNKGTLRAGADADIAIVDLQREWVVDPARFASLGRNTPFEGWAMKGRPVLTICKGRIYTIDPEDATEPDSCIKRQGRAPL